MKKGDTDKNRQTETKRFGGVFGSKFEVPVAKTGKGKRRCLVYAPPWKVADANAARMRAKVISRIISTAGGQSIVHYTFPYIFFTAPDAKVVKAVDAALGDILNKNLCSQVYPSMPWFYTKMVQAAKFAETGKNPKKAAAS
ncbi:MAG: hypothetical protein ABH829_00950 [archaeon]